MALRVATAPFIRGQFHVHECAAPWRFFKENSLHHGIGVEFCDGDGFCASLRELRRTGVNFYFSRTAGVELAWFLIHNSGALFQNMRTFGIILAVGVLA